MGRAKQLAIAAAAGLLAAAAAAEMIPPEAIANNRAEELTTHLDRFDLQLLPNMLPYNRALGKSPRFYQLRLTTYPLKMAKAQANLLHAGITPELAGKLVDHLLEDGFLRDRPGTMRGTSRSGRRARGIFFACGRLKRTPSISRRTWALISGCWSVLTASTRFSKRTSRYAVRSGESTPCAPGRVPRAKTGCSSGVSAVPGLWRVHRQ